MLAAPSAGHPALYDSLVALHVLAAVVGFGAVGVSGVYGATARRPERPGAVEESARYFRSPIRAEWLLLAVPVLGFAALAVRPDGGGFGQLWTTMASAAWLVAAALLLGIVRPAERAIRQAALDPDKVVPATRLMWGAVACDVLFVVALALMITQPT